MYVQYNRRMNFACHDHALVLYLILQRNRRRFGDQAALSQNLIPSSPLLNSFLVAGANYVVC